jgi:hypothetical protein
MVSCLVVVKVAKKVALMEILTVVNLVDQKDIVMVDW